ncbi:MAG TPA: endonuclease MutS2, partial [Spirochaetia bacterium]|nr:endonuclease MutS2 [Spirochaetia bacterium]
MRVISAFWPILRNGRGAPMSEHALRLLEFERVREELADLCAGPHSRDVLKRLPVWFEAQAVAEERERVRLLHLMMESGKKFPALELPDLTGLIRLLGKEGTVAEGQALVDLGVFLGSAGRLIRFLSEAEVSPLLRETVAELSVPNDLERKIFRIFDREGEVQVKLVPALASIQESIKKLRADIEKTAAAMLANPEFSGFFQTNLATIKDGRTVLPLKARHKGKVKGIIHESSGRGQTLYLEPQAVVEKNNRLVVEEHRFQAELHKILRELTGEARGHLPAIKILFQAISLLDVRIAKACYAVRHRCTAALDTAEGIVLREARHPLIGPGAVPVSLALTGGERVLLITGPNTGGKTVTLKTVGLLACMNQFGMEIPAAEGTALPIFDGIFADIGDEQSIEQSLSTFQAHMKNMAAVAGKATSRSLVLLDELGAGTDPQEGTAIAMALLDHFVETGTMTLATTHHGILKNYGFSKHGVVNASVEFDAERLAPTYRLIMGIPGESHALTIARRNGLPHAITAKAEQYLAEERTDIGRMVEELVAEKRRLIEQGEEQREKVSAAEEKLRHADLK